MLNQVVVLLLLMLLQMTPWSNELTANCCTPRQLVTGMLRHILAPTVGVSAFHPRTFTCWYFVFSAVR